MNEGNGHSEEGRAQGVVAWIVVFAVAAVVTGFCAKYLYDWATGNLVTENSGREVVGVVGLTGLFILFQLLRILCDRWAERCADGADSIEVPVGGSRCLHKCKLVYWTGETGNPPILRLQPTPG